MPFASADGRSVPCAAARHGPRLEATPSTTASSRRLDELARAVTRDRRRWVGGVNACPDESMPSASGTRPRAPSQAGRPPVGLRAAQQGTKSRVFTGLSLRASQRARALLALVEGEPPVRRSGAGERVTCPWARAAGRRGRRSRNHRCYQNEFQSLVTQTVRGCRLLRAALRSRSRRPSDQASMRGRAHGLALFVPSLLVFATGRAMIASRWTSGRASKWRRLRFDA